MAEEESEGEVEIDRQLDQSLETKSRQHNLTTVNVKNIIHVSRSRFGIGIGIGFGTRPCGRS